MPTAQPDIVRRLIVKTGNGIATPGSSNDHRNGDWLSTDIYDAEIYMDVTTGKLYTANGGVVKELGAGENLGNADLIADASRTYTLNGSLDSDSLVFENASNQEIFKITGKGTTQESTYSIENLTLDNVITPKQINVDMNSTTNRTSIEFTNSNFSGGGSAQTLLRLMPSGVSSIDYALIVENGRTIFQSRISNSTPNLDIQYHNDVVSVGSIGVSTTKFNVLNSGSKSRIARFLRSDNTVSMELLNSGAMNLELSSININGSPGFSGSGSFTNFTFENGICTSAT